MPSVNVDSNIFRGLGRSDHAGLVPSGYLDTSLIIGLAKFDLPKAENLALLDLVIRHGRGELMLCTSHVAKEELSRHALGETRGEDLIYKLVADVPAVDEQFRMPSTLRNASTSGIISGPIVKDELLERLVRILPGEDDARHIFQAARNGNDYFITYDSKTILRHTEAVEAVVPIKLRSPTQLVADLDTAATS